MSAIPPSLRSSPLRDADRLLASLVAASLLLHFGFVFYLHQLDWPREPIEAIPDQFWHLVPPRPMVVQPPAPAAAGPAAPGKRDGGGGPRHSPPREEVGLLKILGARGQGGLVDDLLKTGASDPEQVFAKIGGVSFAGEAAHLHGDLEFGRKAAGRSLLVTGPRAVTTGDRGAEHRLKGAIIIEPPEEVVGALPAAVIIAEIKTRIGGIRACYEGRLNHDHDLHGKLTLRFVITAAGQVGSVEIENDSLHSGEVASCVKERVAHWRFPPGARPTEFSFPFVFQSSDR